MLVRTARSAVLIALVTACGLGSGPPSSIPSTPRASPATPGPATSTAASLPSASAEPLFPLPPGSVVRPGPGRPGVSLTSSTAPGARTGVTYSFSLQHCGLGSPFDFDGDLWEPTGGRDARGGPIDSGGEIGELINATRGQVTLVTHDQVHFLTPRGSVVALARHDGAMAYALCV